MVESGVCIGVWECLVECCVCIGVWECLVECCGVCGCSLKGRSMWVQVFGKV